MDTPKTVTVIITADAGDHAPALNINGQTFPLAFNTPVELPDFAYAALLESTYGVVTSLVSPPDSDPAQVGDGDGAAVDAGGGSGGTETFDAEAIILGTVNEVAARLAGLTADELAAVEAAEADREKARKGVLDAIAEAKAALAIPSDATNDPAQAETTPTPADNQE